MGVRRILWTLKVSVLSWGVGPEGVKGKEMGASRLCFCCDAGAAAMHAWSVNTSQGISAPGARLSVGMRVEWMDEGFDG